MSLAMCEVPVHPVEHLTESALANLPVLPMTQSADGTYFCDGESTQVVQEQGKNIMDCTKATSIALDKGEGYIRVSGWASILFDNEWIMKYLKPSTTYYYKLTVTMNENVVDKKLSSYQKMMLLYRPSSDTLSIVSINMFGNVNSYLENGESIEMSNSFTTPDDLTNLKVLVYTDRYTNKDGTGNYNSDVTFSNIMLSEVDAPYEPYQPAMPSPEYPSPITNTYPAGTYKAICGDKVYKVALDDDLRSVPNVADRVVIDAGRGKLKIEKGIGYIESYTDETVETVYMSSTGELTEGATVIYQLATPTTHQSIPTQLLTIQSGRSAQLLNTVNDKADFLKVRGDSWQKVQEKGKNLLDNNPAKWKIGYSASWHPIEGTAWAYGHSMNKACIEIPVSPNTKYGFFNSDTENYWISRIIESDNDGLGYVSHVFYSNISLNVEQYSFTSTANTTKLVFQLSTVPDSDSNLPDITEDFIRAIQITLEQGEPTKYTAFQPAIPSPEYQSEIKDVDGVLRSSGWNYYSGSDIEGTQNNNSGIIQTIQPGTYTFMADVESSDTDNTKCFILFYNGTIILNGVIIGRGKGAQTTVTISENVTRFTCYASNSNLNSIGDTFSFRNIQIVKGNTTKPYDRHRGNSITLPTLRGLPDGTRDVLYVDRKAKRAWVERLVGVKEFDGSEPFVLTGITGDNYQGFALKSETYNALIEKHTAMCNIFQYSRNEGILNSCLQDNVEYGLRFTVSTGIVPNKTVNELKAYLAQKYSDGEPVIFYYAISEPVIEELPYSDYLLDTCQWETNISFVDCDKNLVPEIEIGCKVLGR